MRGNRRDPLDPYRSEVGAVLLGYVLDLTTRMTRKPLPFAMARLRLHHNRPLVANFRRRPSYLPPICRQWQDMQARSASLESS
jgi:hypothetical protein